MDRHHSAEEGDGDGIGDLEGVRAHLDHLAWLGVDAVWLSPFYRSPMADFGYDVADFTDVDPLFGDLAAFDRLLAEAHRLGIRVLVDLVPNHTSDQHPWFHEAQRSRDDPKRDWYVWRDGGGPTTPPNNWIGAFVEGPAWTWHASTEQWYLHQFLPQQPDLNWDNPEVVEAMHGVVRFWLDRGVDGFRIDVVHCIGRDPSFPDDVPPWSEIPHCASNEFPTTHAHLRALRRLVDGSPGDRVIVGETALPGTRWVAPYYGDGDELHLALVPWTATPDHGWGTTPWLPFAPDATERSAEAQRADPSSILHLYRRLLAARRASPALQAGDLEVLDAPDGVLAWHRRHGEDERTIAVSFAADPVPLDLVGEVEVASDGIGEGAPFTGVLGGDVAVVLQGPGYSTSG